ncbi:MAG: ATP-binding protein, partial [Candidatus Promineifilaceae bacterium]
EQLQAGRPAAAPATSPLVEAAMSVRGEVIGALGIQDDPDQPLSAEDRELLESISVQVAEALESARLLEQTQRHANEMEAVAQVSAAASTILDAQKLLDTVAQLARQRFGLQRVALYLADEERLRWAAGTAARGGQPKDIPLEIGPESQHLAVARAAETRTAVVVNDLYPGEARPPRGAARSELAVPLVVGPDLLGVLDLRSEMPNRFGADDVRIHTTLGAQVAVALQNAQLYAEQLQAAERLRELDRLKSEFLASMSHELRTPLNSIIGFADVLLEGIDGELTTRMEEDVILIRESGRHLRSLIGEMLDMSKIEAGMMELHYEEIDVPGLAREIVASAKSLAGDKNLELNLELSDELHQVEADRTRLTQVLLNLVSNAIKFTKRGRITLSIQGQNGDLLVAVKDTGIGIRDEDLPLIFEQFRQVDGSMTREAGGTGLGLPISKSLVELHGGDMWVESEPEVGSTFYFTIPNRPPAEVGAPRAGPSARRPRNTRPLRPEDERGEATAG